MQIVILVCKKTKKNKCSAFAYTFLYAYVIIFSDIKEYYFHQVLSGVTPKEVCRL